MGVDGMKRVRPSGRRGGSSWILELEGGGLSFFGGAWSGGGEDSSIGPDHVSCVLSKAGLRCRYRQKNSATGNRSNRICPGGGKEQDGPRRGAGARHGNPGSHVTRGTPPRCETRLLRWKNYRMLGRRNFGGSFPGDVQPWAPVLTWKLSLHGVSSAFGRANHIDWTLYSLGP